MVISSCAYDQPPAYVFLEFPALHEFSGSGVWHNGAVGLFEHGIDLVDPNVAVFSGFPDGQYHFQADGAILPYTCPKWICKLILAKDFLLMRSLTRSRALLELVAPPEQYTPKGHDPKQEYDDLMDFYKTYSNTTIKNVFWSANNYELPHPALPPDTEIVYWYGEKEKKARRGDMAYLKNYIPGVSFTQISGKEHGELLMVYPEQWAAKVKEVCS